MIKEKCCMLPCRGNITDTLPSIVSRFRPPTIMAPGRIYASLPRCAANTFVGHIARAAVRLHQKNVAHHSVRTYRQRRRVHKKFVATGRADKKRQHRFLLWRSRQDHCDLLPLACFVFLVKIGQCWKRKKRSAHNRYEKLVHKPPHSLASPSGNTGRFSPSTPRGNLAWRRSCSRKRTSSFKAC